MIRSLVVTLTSLWIAAAADAASFRLGGDESLGCRMTIEGTIERGDAAQFRTMLADFINSIGPASRDSDHSSWRWDYEDRFQGNIRICLDSPGGSLTEAIEMADTLAFGYRVRSDIESRTSDIAREVIWEIGTAIPAGARCESACAILFMAGGYFSALGTSNNLRDPNRILHVDGMLGFHAPGLDLPPGGSYSAEQVGLSFAFAISAVGLVVERLGRYNIPPSLFQRWVSTSPDDMYFIETVEQAASWFITLAGAPVINDPSLGNLVQVCENMTAVSSLRMSGEQYSIYGSPACIRSETHSMFYSSPSLGFRNRDSWRFQLADGQDRNLRGVVPYEGDECSFEYDTQTGAVRFDTIPSADHGLVANGTFMTMNVGVENFGWLLFPGYTTLQELSALARAHPRGRLPGETLMGEVADSLRGLCAIYDRNDRLLQSYLCNATLASRQRADSRGHEERLSVLWHDGTAPPLPSGWPDSEVWRIGDWEHRGIGLAVRILDGGDTHILLAPQTLESQSEIIGGCYRNRLSGESRCFVIDEQAVSDLSAFRR